MSGRPSWYVWHPTRVKRDADIQGDAEAHNGLGIIHRDGLLTEKDIKKAYAYFAAAAGSDLADAQVNLAKIHIGELPLGFHLPRCVKQSSFSRQGRARTSSSSSRSRCR